MKVSVLIPTWQRPASLRRCLVALGRQEHRPTQIVVSHRTDDEATRDALCDFPDVRPAVVPAGANLVASMNAGLAQTTGDLVALTDDDSEPRPDWLARMVPYFDDATIGGVGGRDWQPRSAATSRESTPLAARAGTAASRATITSGPAPPATSTCSRASTAAAAAICSAASASTGDSAARAT